MAHSNFKVTCPFCQYCDAPILWIIFEWGCNSYSGLPQLICGQWWPIHHAKQHHQILLSELSQQNNASASCWMHICELACFSCLSWISGCLCRSCSMLRKFYHDHLQTIARLGTSKNVNMRTHSLGHRARKGRPPMCTMRKCKIRAESQNSSSYCYVVVCWWWWRYNSSLDSSN